VIRINLLATERERTTKRKAITFQSGQKMVVAGSLILVFAVLFIGWRYWSISRTSSQLDAEIAAAQRETARLKTIIQQVQHFEQQKTQLQQRVTLIEQLRKEQTGPVHMLDQISRALPPMLWLTDLKQSGTATVTIDGRATTLTGLSDFVSNLEASGYFKRSIEIVSTNAEQVQAQGAPVGELVKFSIKAEFQQPGAPAAAAAAAATPQTTKQGG
jgi:type IV pilus assembly protein PilN